MTGTKTEMAAHMSEAHSFLKLECEEEAAPAKKSAPTVKKSAPAADKSGADKKVAKRKPAAPADGSTPAPKKRAPDNSMAGDALMRSWVKCVPCAEIAPAWQCLACRAQFAEVVKLQEHVQQQHLESETNVEGALKVRILGYCCPVCGRAFDELELMIGHQLATHPEAEQPSFECVKRSADWALLCFTCLQYYRRSDKWFTGHQCRNWVDQEALQRTRDRVAVEPCFLCDVCAATFRYKSAYQYHREVRHKGVTEANWDELAPAPVPFVCERCDKGFARADDFKAHECAKVTDEIAQLPALKPKVPCPQCKAVLANAKIMRRHVKTVHEKQRIGRKRKSGGAGGPDYSKYRSEVPTIRCPFCDELRFRTTKDMMAHAKQVHNQELPTPYFCAKCVRQFKTNAKLKRHYEVHHSGPEDRDTVMAICEPATRTKDDTVFYMCPKCARKFLEPMDYFRHHQWHQMKREFTCDRCGYSAPTKEALNVHMRSVHLETAARKFACGLCDSVLSSQFSLREHLAATHGTERPYVCERCGKDFPTKVRLQSHIRTHVFGSQLSTSQRRYGCDLCGKDFKKKQTLRDHLAVHAGVKNEACPVCGKLFYTKLSAYCHRIQTHSTVRPYKCETCEASFPLRSFLTRHMKKHAEKEARKALNSMGNSLWLSSAEKKVARKIKELVAEESNSDTEQSYYEEYESKSFIGEELQFEDLRDIEDYSILVDEFVIPEEMSDLIDNSELEQLDPLKECAELDLESDVKPSSPVLRIRTISHELLPKRAQHRRSAQVCAALDGGTQPLRLADGKFQCPRCDKKFCRKLNAQQHLITHISQKDIKCQHCSFSCYTKSQLDVHQTKHAKRYGCDLCAKMFSYKFQLDTHVQAVHYNMRPFPCSICGKSFKTRYNYGSHMAQHRDVRNFQCPHCPHRCRKSYDLRVHIRTHTGERPFHCSYCERCYSQNSDRLKHERICLLKMKKETAPAQMENDDSAKSTRTKNRAKKLS